MSLNLTPEQLEKRTQFFMDLSKAVDSVCSEVELALLEDAIDFGEYKKIVDTYMMTAKQAMFGLANPNQPIVSGIEPLTTEVIEEYHRRLIQS